MFPFLKGYFLLNIDETYKYIHEINIININQLMITKAQNDVNYLLLG